MVSAAVHGVMTAGMIPGKRMAPPGGRGLLRAGTLQRTCRDFKMPGPVTTARSYEAVDSHTEGMPTRVVVGGIGELPGSTMLERKLRLERDHDEIRQML